MVQQVFGVGTVVVLPPSFQMETHQDVQWTSTVLILMDYSKNENSVSVHVWPLCVCVAGSGWMEIPNTWPWCRSWYALSATRWPSASGMWRPSTNSCPPLCLRSTTGGHETFWVLPVHSIMLSSWKWKSPMYSMVVYLWSWLSAAGPLWSPRPFLQQCRQGSVWPVQFRSIQDDIFVLGKSHVHYTLSQKFSKCCQCCILAALCRGPNCRPFSGVCWPVWNGQLSVPVCVCGRPRWCSWARTWQWPICSRVCVNIYWVKNNNNQQSVRDTGRCFVWLVHPSPTNLCPTKTNFRERMCDFCCVHIRPGSDNGVC